MKATGRYDGRQTIATTQDPPILLLPAPASSTCVLPTAPATSD
jgi:hypothetical protein